MRQTRILGKVTPFLVIVTIENDEIHKQKMLDFDENIKKCYSSGDHMIVAKTQQRQGMNKIFTCVAYVSTFFKWHRNV